MPDKGVQERHALIGLAHLIVLYLSQRLVVGFALADGNNGAGGCPGPANVCSPARMAIDQAMPVLVGIFTQQILQDRRLTDIEAHRKQSTPTGVPDAEICRNALAMRRVSVQRSAGVSDHHHNLHPGEWEHHSCRPPARAERHIVRYSATVPLARIADVHMPSIACNRPHAASCHPAPSEVYSG